LWDGFFAGFAVLSHGSGRSKVAVMKKKVREVFEIP
jgi:hypothetical protein